MQPRAWIEGRCAGRLRSLRTAARSPRRRIVFVAHGCSIRHAALLRSAACCCLRGRSISTRAVAGKRANGVVGARDTSASRHRRAARRACRLHRNAYGGRIFRRSTSCARTARRTRRRASAVSLPRARCFWLPVIAPPPLRPWSYPARLLYLAVALPQGALLGMALTSAREPLYPHYVAITGSYAAALADQRNAAAIMWIAGGLVVFARCCLRWAHGPVASASSRQPEKRLLSLCSSITLNPVASKSTAKPRCRSLPSTFSRAHPFAQADS